MTRFTLTIATMIALLLASAGATPSASAAATILWQPPIGNQLHVESHFDLPNGSYQAGHRGIDMPSTPGVTIRAPTSGTVTFAGVVATKPVLSMTTYDDVIVSFEPITTQLKAGDSITRGDTIGFSDSGGHCAAACLHLGVRVDGEYVNPLRFFWPKPVLLPWDDG